MPPVANSASNTKGVVAVSEPKFYKGTFSAQTDVGKVRLSNEDRASVLVNSDGSVFLCVCDGMGGQNKGDYASTLAMNFLTQSFRNKRKTGLLWSRIWLMRAIREANSLIFEEAFKNPLYKDMGTTCVCVYIQGRKMIIANLGDSRAYSFDDKGLIRLTNDQTYVDYLYRTGKISESEKETSPDRHVLMNALGIYPSASFDLTIKPYSGESILLCTDGLHNNVSEPEIRAVLSTNESAAQKVSSLIQEANGNGGSDNIGIAYWEAIQ